MKTALFLGYLIAIAAASFAQTTYSGLDVGLNNLYMLSNAETRQISPENLTGEKGKGGIARIGEGVNSDCALELGQGWKVNPYIKIGPDSTFVLADIMGPGEIQHIWMTEWAGFRFSILRIYWDGEKDPSVEVPVGDFFACAWAEYAQVNSLPVCVNPKMGLNCYWKMPFRKECKITITNINTQQIGVYFQIDYALTKVPQDVGYFHAQFRKVNPVPYKQVYTIVDSIEGKGQYVGTYLAVGVHDNGWWGEGEVKFYIDGDSTFPTICGTGTEDYFGGAYDWEVNGHYQEYSGPYAGVPQVIIPDGLYKTQERFGMYRWHILDPIRFSKNLTVTIQDLGWRRNGYLARQDDFASVAYWYQTEPHHPFPKFASKDELEEIN